MTDATPQTLAASKAAKILAALGSLAKDKRTWAFLAAVSAAAGYHLSPELAQALGALVDALATS
ncbi:MULTISPECIES: hypothetical protein [unclassified Pseudomonas]|jgi:hypothetical protein|uniref:hypothetical protein n=1 Tax=unclassified Pseudomonas TaxID=196821 RepID=UPI00131B9465|nr:MULTISPECIES: hypothetical protein [unclassified Pseudomonas]